MALHSTENLAQADVRLDKLAEKCREELKHHGFTSETIKVKVPDPGYSDFLPIYQTFLV